MKKIIYALVLALLLTCLLAPAARAADGEGFDADITFVNTAEVQPDLYVTKHVQGEASQEVLSEARFTFRLTLDGEAARSLEYELYDGNGARIYLYQGEDGNVFTSTEAEIPGATSLQFATTRAGIFELGAEQTARFPYVGNGTEYKVEELDPMPEGFELILPVSGEAVGTVTENGADVAFTNQYTPQEDPPAPIPADLVINKRVNFPAGFEFTSEEDFSFTLLIGGTPYANKSYEIIDLNSNQSVGSGTTNAAGVFTLKGNQAANFHNVDTGLEYQITEAEAADWMCLSEREQSGVVKAPTTNVNYANSQASFAVSKEMSDGSKPDQDFTFRVFNASGEAVGGAKYYLYTAGGRRVDTVKHETGGAGTFTLQAGQTAVFLGIPEGTVYSVSEDAITGYEQVTPTTAQGYVNRTVSATLETLRFVNRVVDLTGTVSVTKTVDSIAGYAPANESFTFVILRENNGVFEPLANAAYTISAGGQAQSFRTDSEGKFTLLANQTAVFQRLLYQRQYQVKEIDLPEFFSVEEPVRSDTLPASGSLQFTFNNVYAPVHVTLHVINEGKDGEKLAGATFSLYSDSACTELVGTFTTDENGAFTVPGDLDLGTLYIRQDTAATGYVKKLGKASVTTTYDDGAFQATTSLGDEQIRFEQGDRTSNSEVWLTVANRKYFSFLTSTGGPGVIPFVALGLAGIAGVGIWYRKKKKAEE